MSNVDRGARPWRAQARANRLREVRPWVAAVALLIALPHCPGLNSDFGRSLLSQMGIATVFALSYNLLLGQTGLLSFGHAAYFGLGGFAAIHLMRAINAGLGIPMPLVPLAGVAVGLVFGLLLGAVTTRRGGVAFALISLGVGELVFAVLRMLHGVSGRGGHYCQSRRWRAFPWADRWCHSCRSITSSYFGRCCLHG